MKLTRTTKRTKGMTLLELTVVILVLLSLISILFVGARAWKKGSDRAASVLTIRNVQQAVRSYSNMNGKNAGDTVTDLTDELFGGGKFLENNPAEGTHPAGDDYEYEIVSANDIPEVGVLYLTVTGSDSDDTDATPADYMPESGSYGDW